MAMRFLAERCARSIKRVQIRDSNNMPPNHLVNFIKISNHPFSQSCTKEGRDEGVNGDHLVSLKAASTAITNVGVKSLCMGDSVTFCLRCPKIAHLDVSDSRVTASGITLFLACHQNVVCIDHEETFHALALAVGERPVLLLLP